MKKLLLIVLVLLFITVSGCSCNKFDISTYESAVKNINDSTGYEYTLTIVKKTQGSDSYEKYVYDNKYILKTTGEVYDFSSVLKKYQIDTTYSGAESAFDVKSTWNRYYVGDKKAFYESENSGVLQQDTNVDSYETKYKDVNSEYNIKNLFPMFQKDSLSEFEISGKKNGVSTATFYAPCPVYAKSDQEVILYTVTMDKDFYFSSIKFDLVDGEMTSTYEYEFLNYNSNVVINFPADLVS